MELKEFRKDFENNILMFNSGLDRYIKKEKPDLSNIKDYASILFSYYYPNTPDKIINEIVKYSQNYLELYNSKLLIQKELYKIQK